MSHTIRGPSSFTNPKLRRALPCQALDMAKRLHDIVNECCCRIADVLALPVPECICESGARQSISILCWLNNGVSFLQDIDSALDYSVCSTVGEFVPTIGSTHLDAWEHGFHGLDLLKKLRTSESLSVERFGSNCDGIHLCFISGNVCLEGCYVGIERLVHVRPVLGVS